MAQSGYTPIFIYSSSTASNVPLATNLTNSTLGSELGINITDGKLYYKNNSNIVTLLASASASSGTFSNVTITGGTINGTTIGATTASTGAFTTLSASNQFTSTVTTGTAPFVIASTTNVANLNASSLNGATFASPGSIGSTIASSGSFTTLSASSTISGTGFSSYLASPPAIGGTSANTGTFTTLTATADSSFTSTGALTISKGTTGQQPVSPITGMLRYNTSTNQFEGYSGSSPSWNPVGGSSLSNDTSTSSFEYPLFSSATSGTALTVYTSNAKLLYKPSTGEFQSSELIAGNGLLLNNATVSTSYTVATGNNAMSVGPVTVANGQTVTVSSGQRWVVL